MEKIEIYKESFDKIKKHPHYYFSVYAYILFNEIESFNTESFNSMCKELSIDQDYGLFAIKYLVKNSFFDNRLTGNISNETINKEKVSSYNCKEAIQLNEEAKLKFKHNDFNFTGFFNKLIKENYDMDLLKFLIDFCSFDNNHQTTFYMEKVLKDWKSLGIDSKEKAEKYVKLNNNKNIPDSSTNLYSDEFLYKDGFGNLFSSDDKVKFYEEIGKKYCKILDKEEPAIIHKFYGVSNDRTYISYEEIKKLDNMHCGNYSEFIINIRKKVYEYEKTNKGLGV